MLYVVRYTTRRLDVRNLHVSDTDTMLGMCLKHVYTSDYRQTVNLLLVLLGWQTQQTVGGRGVLPEKLGGGVRPASQSPYPIYDQNLRYSLPYL